MKALLKVLIPILVVFGLTASSCDDPALLRFAPENAASARSYVNGLEYAADDAAPAIEAFRAVTADRNWPAGDAERWVPFITDVMAKESRFCWNIRGGATLANNGCEISRQGRKSDSGFGQVISVHYKYPNGWLCKQEGLCSSGAITANPYDSMTALVAMVERSGGQPWCFNSWARRFHNCRLVPS